MGKLDGELCYKSAVPYNEMGNGTYECTVPNEIQCLIAQSE